MLPMEKRSIEAQDWQQLKTSKLILLQPGKNGRTDGQTEREKSCNKWAKIKTKGQFHEDTPGKGAHRLTNRQEDTSGRLQGVEMMIPN